MDEQERLEYRKKARVTAKITAANLLAACYLNKDADEMDLKMFLTESISIHTLAIISYNMVRQGSFSIEEAIQKIANKIKFDYEEIVQTKKVVLNLGGKQEDDVQS